MGFHPMTTLTCEQLEDRLAALHRASLELVQEITLESLLSRIAIIACQQANARYAAVGVMNEAGELERLIPVARSGDQIQIIDHPPPGLGLFSALIKSPETIRIGNVFPDPSQSRLKPKNSAPSSYLGVPIYQGDRHLGQIHLTGKLDEAQFTADDQQVIETLAAYAAVSISNAHLYQQLKRRDQILTRRSENLALLNELASTLAHSSNIDQILDKSLTQVMDYLNLEAGEIFLRQEDSTILNRVHHRSKTPGMLWEQSQFEFGEGMVGQTALNGQPNLMNLPASSQSSELHSEVNQGRYHQIACFPLNGRQGALGVLCAATNDRQPLGELEIQFLAAISSWIGTAIENVRLNFQQRRLAILEERERIGMDLHDGIIQSIYAVGLTLEHARLLMPSETEHASQRIETAISDLNSTIRDIRSYILDLRPRQLHDENLMQGIQRLMNELRANTLVEVNLHGPDDGLAQLPINLTLALFHICQEALANTAKHARARQVDVNLWTTPDRVLLEVQDDGLGFETDKIKLAIGHGLSNMHTRARNVGGDVDITSEPGAGTTVLTWVPFSRNP